MSKRVLKRYVMILATLCVLVCITVVFIIMKNVDSNARRKQVSEELQRLAQSVRNRPDSRETSLASIEKAAESDYRFERCYALNLLGNLGPLAKESVPTIARGLNSSDGFVRDAAAQALAKLGCNAALAKGALVDTVRTWVHERTALFAIEALGKIGDCSPDVLEALRYAAIAKDSYGRKEARILYEQLTGTSLPAQ